MVEQIRRRVSQAMKKRRYIRPYTGIILAGGLISFVLTDGFVVSRENLILFDPKGWMLCACKALVFAPVSVLASIEGIPKSGNEIHSTHPTFNFLFIF